MESSSRSKLAEEEGKNDNELVQFLASCPQDEVVEKGPDLFDVIFEFIARKAGAAQRPASETQVQAEKQAVVSMRNVLRRLVQNGPNQVEFQDRALRVLENLSRRNQNPGGFLGRIFENLYKSDIILEEAFNLWSASAAPAEKALCKDFFQYLSEAQAESGEDK